MLRGLNDAPDWWQVATQPVVFASDGRQVTVADGGSNRGSKPAPRGAQICFPAGYRIAFTLAEPLVLDPALANR